MPTPPPVSAENVLELASEGTNFIVPTANGEPKTVIEALQVHAEQLRGVRIHQVFGLRGWDYFETVDPAKLRYVSYFLSPALREPFAAGHIDLVPTEIGRAHV